MFADVGCTQTLWGLRLVIGSEDVRVYVALWVCIRFMTGSRDDDDDDALLARNRFAVRRRRRRQFIDFHLDAARSSVSMAPPSGRWDKITPICAQLVTTASATASLLVLLVVSSWVLEH